MGYQFVGSVPTLAQYTITQLFTNLPVGAVIPVVNGGTGLATLPANNVLIGNGTSTPNFAAPGTAGQMLISTGPSTPPAFGGAPTITGGTITGAIVNVTTQNPIENTTLAASDAFVNQQIIRSTATVPLSIIGGTYSTFTAGTGLQVVVLSSGGVVNSILTIAAAGTGYAVGDTQVLSGGNFDARIVVTAIGGGGSVTSVGILYGGTGYGTGLQVAGAEIPPGERSIVFTGVLTSNVTYVISAGTYNDHSRRVIFVNNTTGAFTVTVKLSNGAGGTIGTGVVLPQGSNDSTSVITQTDGEHDVWLAVTATGIGAPSLSGTNTWTGPQTFTNTITPSQTNGIVGTTTNNNVNVGSVGEFITSSVTAGALTSGVNSNVTSISLTAGDWDVWANVQFNLATTATMSATISGISTTSGSMPVSPNRSTFAPGANFATGVAAVGSLPPSQRLSLATTTTVFIVALANFAINNVTADAFISARRVR